MVTPFDSCSDDNAFPPLPPPEPRAVLAHLLQTLAAAFGPAAEGAVDRTLTQLALRLTQFVLQPYPLRALLVGPTGAGKTRLLRVLADAMRLPAAVIPVTDLSETGWRGPQVGEVCRGLFPDLFVRDGDVPRRIVVPRGVITRPCLLLLDEIDKLALVTHDGTRFDGTAAAARLGKQQSLLPVLDPESMLLVQPDDAAMPYQWSLRQSVVIGAGAFAMLPQGTPIRPADLVRIGVMPELADRMGVILPLPEPSAAVRAARGQAVLRDVSAFAAAFDVVLTGADTWLPTVHVEDLVGPRGFEQLVTTHAFDALAHALSAGVTAIDLREVPPADTP